MSLRVEIVPSAEKEFLALLSVVQKRLKPRMLSLGADPIPAGSRKLRNTVNYRIKSGDYRVLYCIDTARRLVTILSIGHRREIYRRLS